MMSKKKLIAFLCLCTLLLSIGISIAQADNPLFSTSRGGTPTPPSDKNTPSPPSDGALSPPKSLAPASPSDSAPISVDIPETGKGHFVYKDGSAIGESVRFTIHEPTGIIGDYTVGLTRPAEYFMPPMLLKLVNGTFVEPENPFSGAKNLSTRNSTVRMNYTIFNSVVVTGFQPYSSPSVYSNFLTFQGSTILMMFFDQEGGGIHYYTGSQGATVTFTIPEGVKIIPETYGYLLPSSMIVNPGTPEGSMVWHSVQLSAGEVATGITVMNGTITASTDRTVTVQLDAYGSVDTYSWIQHPAPTVVNDFWYADLNIEKLKALIEDAKTQGVIPAEGWCSGDTPVSLASNYYTYNDPTFDMDFSALGERNVAVVVNSQIPAGRIVILNIQKQMLETSSLHDLLVCIDNAGIPQANTLEGLMNKVETKDPTGAYYALMGDQLVTVFVYVPHFSTHTISIQSLLSSMPGVVSLTAPILLSAAFTTMVIVGLLLQKWRKDE